MDCKTIALIAGDGQLPLEIARRLTCKGCPPVVYSFGEHAGRLSKYALELVRLSGLSLGFLFDDMRSRGIKEIIMAGVVPKTLLYHQGLQDSKLRQLLKNCIPRTITIFWPISSPPSRPAVFSSSGIGSHI